MPAGRWEWALWWAILLGAIVARLAGLGRESFWVDEIFSAQVIDAPWGEIIDRIPPDKPPLDYYVQAAFQAAGGRMGLPPEVSHRLPAALAGVLMALGVYFWAAGWFGRRTALIAFALAAFNPLLLYHAQEARPYSLFSALVVWQQAAFAAWWRRLARPAGRRRGAGGGWGLMAALVALSLLALYTLYAALLVFASQIVFLILAPLVRRAGGERSGMGEGRGALIARSLGIFAVILVLVWLAATPLRSRSRLAPPDGGFWDFETPSAGVLCGCISDFMLYLSPPAAEPVVAVAFLGLLTLGLARGWKVRRGGALQILLGSVALFPATILIESFLGRPFWVRYTSYCAAGLCILVALAIERLAGSRLIRRVAPSRAAPRRLALGLGLILALAGLGRHWLNYPYHVDWRGAGRLISRQCRPGERVVTAGYPVKVCVEYYLRQAGADGIEVLTQDERSRDRSAGPTWEVLVPYARTPPKDAPFHGITIEHLGAAPAAARFADLARAFAADRTLFVGKCPPELLGEGWSTPEAWSPQFSVRWVTRPATHLYLPLSDDAAGTLAIQVMPYAYKGALLQTVRPILEGRPLARRDLPAGTFSDLAWAVPAGVVHRGFNRLDLEFAWVHSPAAETKNYGDFRTLAAAVSWIRWEARPPVPPAPSR
ncbi:MAG: glycosyltransferase family 39 protein [bacterium]|nr:glycosyltransferase family 39 protein [bacterium]